MGNRRGNQISLTRSTTRPNQAQTPKPAEISDETTQSTVAPPEETAVSKPVQAKSRVVEPDMIRTTMFFTPEMLDRVDAAKSTLTKLTGIRGRAVSRTKIVEMALEIVLADLDNRQEDSGLVNILLNRH